MPHFSTVTRTPPPFPKSGIRPSGPSINDMYIPHVAARVGKGLVVAMTMYDKTCMTKHDMGDNRILECMWWSYSPMAVALSPRGGSRNLHQKIKGGGEVGACSGADTGFQKGGGVCATVRLSTEMWPIHAHVRDVFSLLMKFGGPRKRGGGSSPPPSWIRPWCYCNCEIFGCALQAQEFYIQPQCFGSRYGGKPQTPYKQIK